MVPHITFVTTSNLATNPRLVKEVDLALSLSYKICIVAFRFDNWSLSINEEIKSRWRPAVEIVEISAERNPFLPWLASTLLQFLCRFFVKINLINSFILSQALQKRTILVLYALKRHIRFTNLLIAHNPGSFYPVKWIARKKNIAYGIDVEDYHPGETNNPVTAAWMRHLMVQTIMDADYLSAASPLILEYVKRDCEGLLSPSVLVLNYFPIAEFQPPFIAQPHEPLRLVWFSQYIASGRGLDLVIEAIKGLSDVELHLYGHINPGFKQIMLDGLSNIYIHEPLAQKLLHRQLAKYDIGLAMEQADSNLNRDICLTNKIMAYTQSGLYVLATDTSAQIAFLNEHPNLGIVISPVGSALRDKLLQLVKERIHIRQLATNRYHLGNKQTTEKGVETLSKIWEQLIG